MDDSALLALAPELEAAASAYLRARDHAAALAPSDPGHDAAMAHNLALHGGLEAVTDRICAHRPTTLAGLLLTAHAATMATQEGWDEEPEHIDGDGRLLRAVCDGLFRMVGVDWRGQPLPGGPMAPAVARPHPDAALLGLERELEARLDALARAQAEESRIDALVTARAGRVPDYRDPAFEIRLPEIQAARDELGWTAVEAARDDAHAAMLTVVERIQAIRPRTLDGLRFKVLALRRVELDPDDGLSADILAMTGDDSRPAGSPPAAPPRDAEILTHGEAFDAAFAAYLSARPGELAAEAAFEAAWAAEPGLTQESVARGEPGAYERWQALSRSLDGPIDAANRLRARADVPAEAAFRLPPPRTIAGLAVWARMLAGFHAELWDGPPAELEIDGRMLRATLEATLALAGVDRLGRPAADEGVPVAMSSRPGAPPVPRTDAARLDPDPVFAAIGASRRANAEHIAFCNSPAWGTPDGEAESDRLCHANADAWQALLATPPTTAAGAQALATYAPLWISENGGVEQEETVTLLRHIGRLIDAGAEPPVSPLPMAAE